MRKRYVILGLIALAWLYSWRGVAVNDGPLELRGSMVPLAPFFVKAHATLSNTSDQPVEIIVPCRSLVEIRGIGWFTTGPRCYEQSVSLAPGKSDEYRVEGFAFCFFGDCTVVTGYRNADGEDRPFRARFKILGIF